MALIAPSTYARVVFHTFGSFVLCLQCPVNSDLVHVTISPNVKTDTNVSIHTYVDCTLYIAVNPLCVPILTMERVSGSKSVWVYLMCVAGSDSYWRERKSSLCRSWCFCFSLSSGSVGVSFSSSKSSARTHIHTSVHIHRALGQAMCCCYKKRHSYK